MLCEIEKGDNVSISPELPSRFTLVAFFIQPGHLDVSISPELPSRFTR
jgi:hypothetical protein